MPPHWGFTLQKQNWVMLGFEPMLSGYHKNMISMSSNFQNRFKKLGWIFYSFLIFLIFNIWQGYQLFKIKIKIESQSFGYLGKYWIFKTIITT
jgi:hypothetical protein